MSPLIYPPVMFVILPSVETFVFVLKLPVLGVISAIAASKFKSNTTRADAAMRFINPPKVLYSKFLI